MAGFLIKSGNLKTDMNTGRRSCKDEGRDSQAKECKRLPANHQKPKVKEATDLPSQPSEETNPNGWHLNLGLPASRTLKQSITVVLNHSVSNNLLWQSYHTNVAGRIKAIYYFHIGEGRQKTKKPKLVGSTLSSATVMPCTTKTLLFLIQIQFSC